MKIKVFWGKLKNLWLLSGLWDEVRKYIKNDLDMGNPIEICEKYDYEYHYCPKDMPSDYYSETNYITNFVVKTDKGNILFVKQGSYGVVWDSCKDRIFSIKNDNGEVLVKKSLYENRKKNTK